MIEGSNELLKIIITLATFYALKSGAKSVGEKRVPENACILGGEEQQAKTACF